MGSLRIEHLEQFKERSAQGPGVASVAPDVGCRCKCNNHLIVLRDLCFRILVACDRNWSFQGGYGRFLTFQPSEILGASGVAFH
jgi:hypothetical protein